jgi:hypothetical protein
MAQTPDACLEIRVRFDVSALPSGAEVRSAQPSHPGAWRKKNALGRECERRSILQDAPLRTTRPPFSSILDPSKSDLEPVFQDELSGPAISRSILGSGGRLDRHGPRRR